jgi:hypothetical protein
MRLECSGPFVDSLNGNTLHVICSWRAVLKTPNAS